MAYYFIFPEKDSTLYSHQNREKTNTGHDEIIELAKEKGTTNQVYYPTRVLVKFRDSELKSTISDITGDTFSCSVQLMSSEHKNLKSTQNLELFAISQSWDEGTGRYTNLPTSSDGTSWVYRDNDTAKTKWTTSSFAVNTTGSINASGITEGGGTWYTGTGFESTQQFLNAENLDTDLDVTSIVQKYSASLFASQTYPDGIPNDGFIVKLTNAIETDTSASNGALKYFAVDTHTIYSPKLVFKWDDSSHTYQPSASLSGGLHVSLYGNKKEYNDDEVAKFKIQVRDLYPTRTFTTSSNFLTHNYFTTSSFYSVRDAQTEEEIIPFDENYTKLSADAGGMYFKLHMKGLQPERNYRVLFKHNNNDGTIVYDNSYHFKVVR